MPSLTYRLIITLCQASVAAERYLEHYHLDFSCVHDYQTGCTNYVTESNVVSSGVLRVVAQMAGARARQNQARSQYSISRL